MNRENIEEIMSHFFEEMVDKVLYEIDFDYGLTDDNRVIDEEEEKSYVNDRRKALKTIYHSASQSQKKWLKHNFPKIKKMAH